MSLGREGAVRQEAQRIGEVVEASTGEFVAQCYRLYEAPVLGSLVRTGGEGPVFGVVYSIETQSIDPGRRPIARGEDEETEEGVYQSNPQLSQLLRTDVHALVVGHQEGSSICHNLPPSPPRIHAFVYQCSREEVAGFTASLGFLSILLDARVASQDQVLAACLRGASDAHVEPREFLLAAGKELALLLGGQLQRLNTILRRLAV